MRKGYTIEHNIFEGVKFISVCCHEHLNIVQMLDCSSVNGAKTFVNTIGVWKVKTKNPIT